MGVAESPAWARLAEASRAARSAGLRAMFDDDPRRSDSMRLSLGGGRDALALDLSMQHLAARDLALVGAVADETGLLAMRALLREGGVLNPTEGRAVTHVRDRIGASKDLSRALEFAAAVRSGAVVGSTGRAFATVINLGIGGSDLGPRLVARAIGSDGGPAVRFVAGIDPIELDEALADADPHTTMFVVSSKSMSTTETLLNAERARLWLDGTIDGGTSAHFAAVTAEAEAAAAWGVPHERVFTYDRGIGGRFSVSSAAGLAAAISGGPERFGEFLAGMIEMDRHFLEANPSANIPVLHGVIAVLNSLVHGSSSWAVVPYAGRLALLVPYLQQLTMESNGKSTALDGRAVGSTAPALWGSVGTEGQHAYFQWLHQGTDPTPVDFVIVGSGDDGNGHDTSADAGLRRRAADLLVAHAVAQAEALAFGRSAADVRATGCEESLVPHRVFVGNRPSGKVLLRSLTPRNVGHLLAMYEHSTAVQGWLWGVNSFDQFGVELGKELAATIVGSAGGASGSASGDVDGGSPPRTAIRRWLRG